jgi:hypothetical protein
LHIVHAGDLAQTGNDAFQVFEIFNIDDDVDIGLAVGSASFDIADVGAVIADNGCDLLEYAGTVVAEQS